MDKYRASVAGEYAVASEICRGGKLAQITYGNMKQVDIIVISVEKFSFVTVEVKSCVSGREWPGVKGIPNDNSHLLVFVDFYRKDRYQRPDYYVLNGKDWRALMDQLKGKRYVELYDGFIPTYQGKRGITIRWKDIKENSAKYKDNWDKSDELLR